jgi:CRP-like cAMP-binding protein
MIALRKFIENYSELPDVEWDIIKQAFERREIEKNELIVSEGSVCKYFFFLEEGLIRYFIFNDGNDITKFFTAAPNCFTSITSFRPQKPAQENIQSLEKSIVWQITLNQANELLELKSWNTFVRNFVNEVQISTEELMMESKTESAEQRYEILLEKYPQLIQKIPLKHLSTFLGIEPQSMSRIRKKLSQKERT